MRTLNEVRLLGNIGANPTSHETDKIFVVKLSLATNGMNPNTGEISPPQWHRVTMFDKLARYAMQEVRKGMRIEVEGRLKYTTYEDSKGIERFGCEVIANRLWVIAKPQNQPQPEEQPEEAPEDHQRTVRPATRDAEPHGRSPARLRGPRQEPGERFSRPALLG